MAKKKEGRRTHIKRDPILYVDLVWKPDSNQLVREEMFEPIKKIGH